ncbi:MAG: hypothetical protein IT332_06350 [Ardenticatenales bacterium]|nr:hypothetical protein [Ardenticatenales bacterium]
MSRPPRASMPVPHLTAAVAAATAALVAAAFLRPPAVRHPAARAQGADAPWTGGPVDQFGGRTAVMAAGDDGSTVWVGHGPRVVALNVADPAAPVAAGRTAWLDGIVTGLAVDGERSVAITGGEGQVNGGSAADPGTLAVLDVGDAAAPTVIGRVALPGANGARTALALRDGIAFVVRSVTGTVPDDGTLLAHSGLSMVDIRQPAAPRILVDDLIPPPLEVTDVVVIGDVLAVAVASGTDDSVGIITSLLLYRLAGDAPPTLLTEHESPAWRVLAREAGPAPRAIVYGQGSGGLALDISNPSEPREVRRWDGSTWCHDCLRLLVGADGGVSMVSPGGFGGGYVASVGAGGQVATALSLLVRPSGGAAVVGAHIVFADVGGDVRVLDMRLASTARETDPTVGQLALQGNAVAVAFDGDADDGNANAADDAHAYTAPWEGGLRTLSPAHPTHPPLVGGWRSAAYRSSLDAGDSWALTSYEGEGDALTRALDVFALGRPEKPAHIGRLYDGRLGRLLHAGDRDWAVVAGTRRGGQGEPAPGAAISVYALSPASATEQEPSVADVPAGTLDLQQWVTDVDIDGQRLVAVGRAWTPPDDPQSRLWIEVVDLTNPAAPARRLSAALDVPPAAASDGLPRVALDGDTAVVVTPLGPPDPFDGLPSSSLVSRIDVSGAAPRVTAGVALSGTVASVAMADGYAFVGPVRCEDASLTCVVVLDARAPDALRIVGWLTVPAGMAPYALGRDAIAVRGWHVFVAADNAGVWVFTPPLDWARPGDRRGIALPWLGREAVRR